MIGNWDEGMSFTGALCGFVVVCIDCFWVLSCVWFEIADESPRDRELTCDVVSCITHCPGYDFHHWIAIVIGTLFL